MSLAIGRGGQNVRLAAKLIGWHLDIISEREREELAAREEAEAAASYDFLISLPGVGEKTALALYESGFGSADEILAATPEELAVVPGIGLKTAAVLKRKVTAQLAELTELGLEPPKPEDYIEVEAAAEGEEEAVGGGEAAAAEGAAEEGEEPPGEAGEAGAEPTEASPAREEPADAGRKIAEVNSQADTPATAPEGASGSEGGEDAKSD